MGIHKFFKLLFEEHRDVIEYLSPINLKNKKIGVDANNMIYTVMKSLIKKNKKVKNKKDKDVYHIYAILEIINTFIQNEMIPIFLFDGDPPDMKTELVEERKTNKKESKKKLKEIKKAIKEGKVDELSEETKEIINDKEKIKDLKINSLRLGFREQRDIIRLLETFQIPYIKCEGEADITCGYLSKHEIIDYVLTNDSDILCFGAKKILLSFFFQKNIIEIDIKKIKDKFGITF